MSGKRRQRGIVVVKRWGGWEVDGLVAVLLMQLQGVVVLVVVVVRLLHLGEEEATVGLG